MSSSNSAAQEGVNSDLLPVEMPAVQHAISTNAGRYHSVAQWLVAGVLLLTAIYALASPIAELPVTINLSGHSINLASLTAGGAFLIAFFLHIIRLINRPERKWQSSRGLSEEIKSFAWRFAVGGQPLGKSQVPRPDAEEALSRTLHSFLRQARKERLEIPLPKGSGALPFITDWMAKARDASLNDRQALYAAKRILSQQEFYRKRTISFRRSSTIWSILLLVIEGGLALAAGAHAVGLFPLNFFGVGATLVAAGTSWIQFSQYRSIADLYSDMAFELGEFYRRCTQPAEPWTEDTWATFVSRVESFLAAEHGAWRKLVDPDGQAEAPQVTL